MAVPDVNQLLSKGSLTTLALMCLIPIFYAAGSRFEGYIFPVVSKAEIYNEKVVGDDVYFYLNFKKYESCEFMGVNWRTTDGIRLLIEFEPDATKFLPSRPVGVQRAVGPWKLNEVNSLEYTEATTVHRCHPLWLTYTPFYPTKKQRAAWRPRKIVDQIRRESYDPNRDAGIRDSLESNELGSDGRSPVGSIGNESAFTPPTISDPEDNAAEEPE